MLFQAASFSRFTCESRQADADFEAKRAALVASETTSEKLTRLNREAADLDARADRIIELAEVNNYAGKAAYRRARGELDIAASHQSQADAETALALKLRDDAFRLRIQAAGAQADLHFTSSLMEIVA